MKWLKVSVIQASFAFPGKRFATCLTYSQNWALIPSVGTRDPDHVHHPLKCTIVPAHNSPTLNNHKMVDEQAIKAALAAIDTQGVRNYRQITKDYDLIYITVIRR